MLTKTEPETIAYTFAAAHVRKAIKACAIATAISTEETRYYLNGIFLELNASDGSHMTATDGHRLVRWTLGAAAKGSRGAGVIISRKGVKALQAWIGTRKTSVTFSVSTATGALTASDATRAIAVELIDGTYPDYRRIIPYAERGALSFKCNPKDLRAELERIVQGAKAWQGKNVTVAFAATRATWINLTGNYVRQTRVPFVHTFTRGPRRGQTETRFKAGDVEVQPFDGKVCPGPIIGSIHVGFNASYVLGLLGKGKGPVAFHGDDAGSPWRIEMPDGALRILMPCRI